MKFLCCKLFNDLANKLDVAMTVGRADVSMSQYLALRIQVMTAASTPCPHAAVFADILICICSEAQPSPA